MTKEYDESKNEHESKFFQVLYVVLALVVILGVVGIAIMFFLMLFFPNGTWTELFR